MTQSPTPDEPGAKSPRRTRGNPYYAGPPNDHFDGRQFFMAGRDTDKSLKDLVAWSFGGGKVPWPGHAPAGRDVPPARVAGLRVAHIGHASYLLQTAGLNLLVDPVYAERASPVRFAGPKRVNAPGVAFDDLPLIDAVLVTHNHYDHLCLDTIARLVARDAPRIVTPLGNDAVIRARVPAARVEAHDWHDRVALAGDVAATLEPAYHWSARGYRDRRMALWAGFVLSGPAGTIYLAGDTAYHDGSLFRQIRERHGAPDLAVLPIGAYEPRWFMKTQHVNPREAVKIFEDVGARAAIGVHWGTFRLTNEGIDDPPQALARALARAGIDPARFRPVRPGDVYEAEGGATLSDGSAGG